MHPLPQTILGGLLLSKPHSLILLLYTSSAKLMHCRFLRDNAEASIWGPLDHRGYISYPLDILFELPLLHLGSKKLLSLYMKLLEETNESLHLNYNFQWWRTDCPRSGSGARPLQWTLAWGVGWYTTNMASRTNPCGQGSLREWGSEAHQKVNSTPLNGALTGFPIRPTHFRIVAAFLALQLPFLYSTQTSSFCWYILSWLG